MHGCRSHCTVYVMRRTGQANDSSPHEASQIGHWVAARQTHLVGREDMVKSVALSAAMAAGQQQRVHVSNLQGRSLPSRLLRACHRPHTRQNPAPAAAMLAVSLHVGKSSFQGSGCSTDALYLTMLVLSFVSKACTGPKIHGLPVLSVLSSISTGCGYVCSFVSWHTGSCNQSDMHDFPSFAQ